MDILKISIVIAIVGIAALFFIERFSTEETKSIKNIKIGQIERVSGMVTSVYTSKSKNVFLKVADNTGEVAIVAFKDSNIDGVYDLEVGDQVTVLGRVNEYKGELEIIAKEINKL